MGKKIRSRVALSLIVAAVTFASASATQAAVFNGNGGTGFGGPVGTGSLAVTDNGAGDVTFAFTPGAAHPSVDGNNLVIYLSTGAAGLSDTSALIDNGDSGRRGISGFNSATSTRSLVAFPSGFQATYALAIEGGYAGLFQLPPAGGDGNLTYLTGAAQSGNPLTVTIPLATLGLTQGQSFQLVGTLIDGGAAYRSNEAIGDTSPNIAASGNPGFDNLITFSSAFTFNSTVIPEPASLAILSLGGGLLVRRRVIL